MSFVARPPEADLEPTPEEETPVTNDGFFPDIDPLAVRAAQRVPPSITAARLRAALDDPQLREQAVRRYASSAVEDGRPDA